MENQQAEQQIPEDEVELLEVAPKESWFVETMDEQGRALVFVRIHMTGLLPRRAGPFPNRQAALNALDHLLSEVCSVMDCEWSTTLERYCLTRPFACHSILVQTEDELGQAYLEKSQKSCHKPTGRRGKPSKRKAV